MTPADLETLRTAMRWLSTEEKAALTALLADYERMRKWIAWNPEYWRAYQDGFTGTLRQFQSGAKHMTTKTDEARECAEETISGFPAVVIKDGADGKPLTTYDYWHAVGDTKNEDFSSLGYTWADKPHRLLYDLLKFIETEHAKHFPPSVPVPESKTQYRRLVAQGAIEPSVPCDELRALAQNWITKPIC